MKTSKNSAGKKQATVKKVLVDALVTKKEVKSRIQKGESLRKVAAEKNLKVVLPV